MIKVTLRSSNTRKPFAVLVDFMKLGNKQLIFKALIVHNSGFS